MILRFLSVLTACMGLSLSAQAQYKEVARTDVDPRITIFYNYELTSPGSKEEIRFKVKNNSARELRVTIKVEARYRCNVNQNFTVGINGSVHLQPNEFYNGSSDYVHSITQKSKDCMREIEPGRYSSFMECSLWVNIVDITAEKEAKAAADKKKEDERAKAAADAKAASDKKIADDKKKADDAIKASNQSGGASSATSKTDDFWETQKKSSVSSSNSNTGIDGTGKPDLVRTTDGKYYQKDANNKMKEISYDEYMQIKHDRSQAARQTNATQRVSDAEAKAATDKIMNKVNSDFAANEKIYKDIDNKFAQYAQASANNQAVNESRENLREASSLSGNFRSLEQLMAEFNQKMSQVNYSVEQLRVNKDAAWNHAVNSNFNTPGYEAYGEVLKGVGAIVNAAKAEKERKEAQAALRAQKLAAEKAMIEEEKRLLTNLRTDLFSRFKEGTLPLSSTKLEASTIYYFVYAYDPAQISSKQPTLFVSNVFQVNRYSDGTWPFKTTFSGDIQKLTPFNEIMHGYYTSEQQAESMRKGLINIFQQSGGIIQAVAYKSKKTSPSSSSSSSGDFWETGSKKEATNEKKPVKKDDFWEN